VQQGDLMMASGNRGRYLVTCVLTTGLEVTGLVAGRLYALAFITLLASATALIMLVFAAALLGSSRLSGRAFRLLGIVLDRKSTR
jgi:hypothetical protein